MAVAQKKKLFDGRYEIISIVGRGSRSVVYHARNTTDGNAEVALKVLVENKKDTISLSEKLRREALALVSSHHPSVIRLDDFHSVGEICYLAMEYAPEVDLRKFSAKRNGNLDADTIHEMLLQVSDGLDYIHRTGIIHRDIKPDNILVVSPTQFRIGDFGVAFLPGDAPNAAELRNAVGTMDYMAPEVLEGIEYTQRSDIYSLGVSAYELLSGKNPFASASMAEQLEIRKNLTPLSQINPQIPEYLSAIIQKACAYEAQERFQSAKEIIQLLKSKKSEKQRSSTSGVPELKVISGKSSIEPTEDTNASTNNSYEEPDVLDEETTESESNSNVDDFSQPQDKIVDSVPAQEPALSASSAAEEQSSEERSDDMMADIALKDSRASRSQTVFISKESVEQIRAHGIESTRRGWNISNGTLLAASVVILVTAFIALKVLRSKDHSEIAATQAYSAEEDPSSAESTSPSTEGDGTLAFPQLPTGVYSGTVSGVIGNAPVPLTMLSFANRGKLAVVIGAEGFNPAVLDVSNSGEKIKLVANGYIIEFQGQAQDGVVVGTVKNLVTGINGAFKIKLSST